MKQGFPDPLHATALRRRRWKLLDTFRYVSEDQHVYSAPRSFVTDGYSVPRFLVWLVPDWAGPAVIHDRLYETAEVPRELADRILAESSCWLYRDHPLDWRPGMRQRIRAMWLGVRSFGWIPWLRVHGSRN